MAHEHTHEDPEMQAACERMTALQDKIGAIIDKQDTQEVMSVLGMLVINAADQLGLSQEDFLDTLRRNSGALLKHASQPPSNIPTPPTVQ